MEISTIMPGPIVHTGRKIPEYISSPILKPGIKVHGGRCNPVTKHLAAEAALLAPVGVVMCCIHFLYHGRSVPVSCCARSDLTSFSLEHSTIETGCKFRHGQPSLRHDPLLRVSPSCYPGRVLPSNRDSTNCCVQDRRYSRFHCSSYLPSTENIHISGQCMIHHGYPENSKNEKTGV